MPRRLVDSPMSVSFGHLSFCAVWKCLFGGHTLVGLGRRGETTKVGLWVAVLATPAHGPSLAPITRPWLARETDKGLAETVLRLESTHLLPPVLKDMKSSSGRQGLGRLAKGAKRPNCALQSHARHPTGRAWDRRAPQHKTPTQVMGVFYISLSSAGAASSRLNEKDKTMARIGERRRGIIGRRQR